MIKPDGVHRGLVGDIIKRFEQKGFKLVAMKFQKATVTFGESLRGLEGETFLLWTGEVHASGPVLAMVWEGLNVVKTGRVLLGETNPVDSLPGTIRGDFA